MRVGATDTADQFPSSRQPWEVTVIFALDEEQQELFNLVHPDKTLESFTEN